MHISQIIQQHMERLQLDELGLAKKMGISLQDVLDLLYADVSIDKRTAKKLNKVFGFGASYWMNLS